MPFFDIISEPKNEAEELFQKLHYSLKSWGYISINSGEDFYTYLNLVKKLSNKYSLDYTLSEGYVYEYINNISYSLNSLRGYLLIFNIIISIAMSVFTLIMNISLLKDNLKLYEIYIISGCLPSSIYTFIGIKTLIWYITSTTTAYILALPDKITRNYYMIDNSRIIVFFIVIIIISINIAVFVSYMRKTNIVEEINKKQ